MKVLEAPVWWEFTCQACGALCQAEPKDVVSRPNIDYEGDTIGHICVVECGRCGKQRDVPKKLLTEKIEKIAARKRRKNN